MGSFTVFVLRHGDRSDRPIPLDKLRQAINQMLRLILEYQSDLFQAIYTLQTKELNVH